MKIKFINDYKKMYNSLKTSNRHALPFILLSLVLAVTIIYPVMILLYHVSIKLSGYSVITVYNILKYLFKPFTIPIVLVIAFVYIMFFLFQISTLSIIFDKNLRNLSFSEVLKRGLNRTLSYFKKENIGFFFILMILIPLTALVFQGYDTISITTEMVQYVIKNTILTIFAIIFIILIVILLLKYILAFAIFATTKLSFKESLKKSSLIAIKNYYRLVKLLAKTNLLLIVGYYLFYYLTVLIIFLCTKIFNSQGSLAIVLSIIYGFNIILKYIATLLFIVLNCSVVSYINNRETEEISVEEIIAEPHTNSKRAIRGMRILAGFSVVILAFAAIVFYVNIQRGILSSVGFVESITITSHRGYSKNKPGNSMPAYEAAINSFTDDIELDCQMTKDGFIVCYHDASLSAYGLSGSISDYNYYDLQRINLSDNPAEESPVRIPLLETVLKEYKNKAYFNIEIKFTNNLSESYVKEFCDAINDVIVESNAKYQVYFTSFNLDSIKYMKEIYSYKTGYIVTTMPKELEPNYYDLISIQYQNIDYKGVTQAHNLGLEVHVWTVNDSKIVVQMIDIGVDAVITDDPEMVRKIIYADKQDIVLQKVIALFFDSDEDLYQLLLK